MIRPTDNNLNKFLKLTASQVELHDFENTGGSQNGSYLLGAGIFHSLIFVLAGIKTIIYMH